MKKILALLAVPITLALLVLSGCGGAQDSLLKLDKQVKVGQTIDQFNAIVPASLKTLSTVYNPGSIQETANGSWAFPKTADAAHAYQVVYFTPQNAGQDSFAVFFKDKACIGKAWFAPQNAVIIEGVLKGQNFQNTTTTAPATTK